MYRFWHLFLHLSKNSKLCSTGLETGCKPVLFYSATPLNSFHVCYSTETYKVVLKRPQRKLGQHCAARCWILTGHDKKMNQSFSWCHQHCSEITFLTRVAHDVINITWWRHIEPPLLMMSSTLLWDNGFNQGCSWCHQHYLGTTLLTRSEREKIAEGEIQTADTQIPSLLCWPL